ncbi:hypothetical protein Moror_2242, partial [Moniliophthora roreri MCA 2997]|uniref:F-box domain-containing protein n=2 Tax=Moniliophthora roreri TaxID=221103 RepID=A0A0W0FYV4_MONRR
MVLTSRFTSFLDTNFAPNPEEIEEIQNIVRDPQKDLHLLEEEILHLQERRNELKSFIDQHQEIFIRCLPDDRIPTCSVTEPPLVFTIICRTWREVAIGSPRLWNAVHITLPTSLHPQLNTTLSSIVETRTEGVKRWLDRSGSLPISFALHSGLWFAGHGDEEFMNQSEFVEPVLKLYQTFIEMLMSYCSRWKHVCFAEVPTATLSIAGKLDVSAMPLLERFQLLLHGWDNGLEPPDFQIVDVISPVSALLQAPNLRSISLYGGHVSPLNYPVRCDLLSKLDIGKSWGSQDGILSARLALEVVARCSPALRSLLLDICPGADWMMQQHSSPMLMFPNLRELSVEFYKDMSQNAAEAPEAEIVLDEITTFFNAIHTPSLVSLSFRLEGLNLPSTDAPPPFIPFIQRCKCDLLYLSLRIPLQDTAFIDCLPLLPSLTVLKLAEYRIDDLNKWPTESTPGYLDPQRISCNTITEPLLQALVPTEGYQKLETVHFISVSPSMAPALFRFSKARQLPFRTFRVDFCDFLQELEGTQVSSWLKELRNDGWDVRWRSPISQRKRLKGDPNEGWMDYSFPFGDMEADPNTKAELKVTY